MKPLIIVLLTIAFVVELAARLAVVMLLAATVVGVLVAVYVAGADLDDLLTPATARLLAQTVRSCLPDSTPREVPS